MFFSLVSFAEIELVKEVLSESTKGELAKYGLLFIAASWIHSSRVKKEIKESFAGLTDAINNVAQSFSKDLKVHSERLDNMATRVGNLETLIIKKEKQ